MKLILKIKAIKDVKKCCFIMKIYTKIVIFRLNMLILHDNFSFKIPKQDKCRVFYILTPLQKSVQ